MKIKNTMEKEYIVIFKHSIQISPEDFKVVNPTMKVNDKTTVKEIADFFISHIKGEPVEVSLIQVKPCSNK